MNHTMECTDARENIGERCRRNGDARHTPQLVVMLTHNDLTVDNAAEVFESCRDTHALYWGMKEEPLPPEQMEALYARMRRCGMRTVLEVVAYDEASGLRGAQLAARCGCDILMGTMFHESIARYCSERGMGYMPFVGTIIGRPSVLTGTADTIIAEAHHALSHGATGIDLLGYRFVGDAEALNRAVVQAVDAPVCLAGSIDSYDRLDRVKQAAPWGFTIGSAFFNNRFGDTFAGQIDNVLRYIGR